MLLCKDKNFKANHNTLHSFPLQWVDVCYYAKIRILKQITTIKHFCKIIIRCLLLCKDKNFKANHNVVSVNSCLHIDVCYYAKIRILKQITTLQPQYSLTSWCLLLCKDKNFKANHNSPRMSGCCRRDVCYYAKIRILKQITTWCCFS